MEKIIAAIIVGFFGLLAVYYKHHLEEKSEQKKANNSTSGQVNKYDVDEDIIENEKDFLSPPDSHEELIVRIKWIFILFGSLVGLASSGLLMSKFNASKFITNSNPLQPSDNISRFVDLIFFDVLILSIGVFLGIFIGVLLGRAAEFLIQSQFMRP